MVTQKIKFNDFKGIEREEEFMFNLTQAELLDMNMSYDGGMQAKIEKIIAAKSVPEIAAVFKKILMASYGEVSDDGRRFVKQVPCGTDSNGKTIYHRLADDFAETEAYSQLYMQLATDDKFAADFINGVLPKVEQPAEQN